MTEEREWMKRIQEENVHLKNQIRLLKENYELRLLLGQQCNNSNQVQLSAPHVSSTYPDMGSLLKGAQYTGREHLNYPPHLISKDTTNLSCPSAQTQMKRLHNDPTFFHPRAHYKAGRLLGHSPSWPEELASSRMTNASNKEDILTQASFPDDLKIYKGGSSSRISERQPHHLLSSTQESSKEKTQPEPQEMLRKKRVSFSDEPDSDKLKKFHTFYLNDIELAQNNKRNGRIVGEIAFQLDRRILAHVFPGITRLYGFTVSNIPEKIKQVSMKSLDGSVDEKKYRSMTQRYLDLTTRLEKMGYHKEFHPVFSEFLINTYGILKQRPDLSSNPMHNNPADLRKVVIDIVPSKFLGDTLLLLNCLCELSKEDNKALFAW
ncbi:speriolin-like protein isoform X4 [Sceloporus undulatus]|uniref:speriolin-like protein isoform X4 n=1 Tax=Sceloporus undulatus TaxID=8520 RepID=UPI001C4BDC7A|nr:speriolin-like protein isoform X4 [Sceloporus undulatus]